jgi:transcriptional regulator with GAF, ATPase, and Fis domain
LGASAYLVARRDDGFGDVYPLEKGVTYSVGRSPKNRIALNDDLCSRDHAEVSFAEGQWYVRDLDSLNGTKVNGRPIRNDVKVDPGDEVQFGRSKFLFVADLADLPGAPDTDRPMDERLEVTRKTKNSKYFRPGKVSDTEEITLTEAAQDRTLASLYRLALDMGAAKSLEQLSNAVLTGLFDGVPSTENGAIMSVTNGREYEVVAYRNRQPDAKVRTFHKSSQLVSNLVMEHGEAILANNLLHDPTYSARDSIQDLKAGSLICVPVIVDETIVALIHLYTSAKKKFTDDDLDFSVAVGRHLSVAWGQLRRSDALTNTNRELQNVLRIESELVGNSKRLAEVMGNIGRVAKTQATVLVRGESGSGKELVARAIHFNSHRVDGPFVTLNCAAITESLLESELFGHERGAYTGATERMVGKFEAADHGTIFLDEIGEMPLSTQAKFLRVLEGHPFERLGGNNLIKVDVRVVAATNRPLEQAVRDGSFRKDLFYRLQVVEIRIPPLRERLEDVPDLAEHFLKKFTRETGRKIKGFTDDAIDKLKNYAWPGNVRELKNVIERAVALHEKLYLEAPDIWLSSLDPTSSGSHPVLFRPMSLEEVEKRHIRETLKHTEWNKSRSAEILEIERSTLDRKIKAYDLRKE